ncbi:alpha/beta hydrolase [Cochleicola gelatinilyticus]|uniref:Alpha/beta hydrolase n=1 Tax=Cochleicola gelatinilyticus TaxID=1763537 RepID=A0A167KAA9_9FLAO|nr:alpha/beta hydrolase [Cochleicola gelatinilyticus]OAB81557.1 alpha/beta hydrolase [Cochleicola gelatinilyticus]
MKKIFLILLISCFGIVAAQENTFVSEELSITPLVDGTLLLPDTSEAIPLVIIIAGSGPTDRNGNQQMAKNNALKFLAEGLYKEDIASFRYDKRILKIMKSGNIDETKIKFDAFMEDAIAVLNFFKNDKRFSKIHIAGHSQGSLIGMVAAQKGADGFISIAGAGQEIDDVIVDQLGKQAPALQESARKAFDDLRVNGVTTNYSPGLASIFRPAIQPFLANWMQYDPKVEISKLTIPVLIIQGDKDVQVQVSEAELLKQAAPEASYELITNMNHILKEIKGDNLENQKSYNEYNRPVMPEVITAVATFVKK